MEFHAGRRACFAEVNHAFSPLAGAMISADNHAPLYSNPSLSDPVVLHAKRGRYLQQSFIAAIFVAGCALVLVTSTDTVTAAVAWIGIAFFGLAALVFLNSVVFPPTLQLDPSGFSLRDMHRTRRFTWHEVEHFAVGQRFGSMRRRRDAVYFDVASPAKSRAAARMRRLNRALAGFSMMLPDTYGLSAKDLAQLLNTSRQAARS